jgi:hypothetical protein
MHVVANQAPTRVLASLWVIDIAWQWFSALVVFVLVDSNEYVAYPGQWHSYLHGILHLANTASQVGFLEGKFRGLSQLYTLELQCPMGRASRALELHKQAKPGSQAAMLAIQAPCS